MKDEIRNIIQTYIRPDEANINGLVNTLDSLLSSEFSALKAEVEGLDGPTVGEVQRWMDKHDKLTSSGAKLVHAKQLLELYRDQVLTLIEKRIGK